MITDACIRISDSAVSSVSDLVSASRENGWSRCAVVGGIRGDGIIPAVRIHVSSIKELQTALRSADRAGLVIVDAGDGAFNRFAVTSRRVSLLAGMESLPKNGFDHITAKFAADSGTGVLIELSVIVDYRTRRHALRTYADILGLRRKYGFPLLIGSGAQNVLGLRTVQETVALCSLFGMTRSEVYSALNGADAILHPACPVEVVPE